MKSGEEMAKKLRNGEEVVRRVRGGEEVVRRVRGGEEVMRRVRGGEEVVRRVRPVEQCSHCCHCRRRNRLSYQEPGVPVAPAPRPRSLYVAPEPLYEEVGPPAPVGAHMQTLDVRLKESRVSLVERGAREFTAQPSPSGYDSGLGSEQGSLGRLSTQGEVATSPGEEQGSRDWLDRAREVLRRLARREKGRNGEVKGRSAEVKESCAGVKRRSGGVQKRSAEVQERSGLKGRGGGAGDPGSQVQPSIPM